MELAVIGNSSRYLSPLGAGTSYLLRTEGARFLLDCGNGTALRLAHELGGDELSAVLVSHFHLDTVADLFPVAFSLRPGTPLIVPRGALPRLMDLLRGYSMDRSWIANARVEGVARGMAMHVADARFSFAKAGHGCPGVATRIEADGRSLVYLGDTGPRAWLAEFARDADLIVAHSLLLDGERSEAARTNLTAGEAGRLARAAGAKKLALSHIPFYHRADESAAEAKASFGRDVVVLREGARVAV